MQKSTIAQFLSAHRAEFRLFAAMMICLAVLIFRVQQQSTPVAIDAAVPAPIELSDQSLIERLQERIKRNPHDTDAYAQLGLGFLQQVREKGDPMLYPKAKLAFATALAQDPQQPDALIGQGLLALAQHQFSAALRWGEQARAATPMRAQVYGVIGDAQVELGRYEEAIATIQKMVDTRPDLASYSRVSYLRELNGDTSGAITAMHQAVQAGNLSSEHGRWTQVQLGHLYFNSGDLAQAERTYAEILYYHPDYIYAQAGIARVRAAQGKFDEAITLYQQAIEQLPLPEFVIALGDIYEASGRAEQAKAQYDLVHVIQKLNASAGVDVDLELTLFDTDHGGNPAAVVQRARAVYQIRPTIYGADLLSWALYRNGEHAEAQRYSQQALRLGTRDAMLYYHAGMIANALGDRVTAANHLKQAFAINPFFSIRYAEAARSLLAEIEATQR